MTRLQFQRRRLTLWAAAGCLAQAASLRAWAHGDWKPQHGGILNDGETTFEFVPGPTTLTIYISDHGEPLPAAGAKGQLDVTRAGRVMTFTMVPAGASHFTVAIATTLQPGDRLMARVELAEGSIRVGRIKLE